LAFSRPGPGPTSNALRIEDVRSTRNILPCPARPLFCQSVSARTYEASGGPDQRPHFFSRPHRSLRMSSSSGPGEREYAIASASQLHLPDPGCPAFMQEQACLTRRPSRTAPGFFVRESQAAVPPTCLSRPSRSILALARAPPSVASPAHAAERGSSFSAARPPALPAPQDRTRPSWRSTSQHPA
jgi:hypothetical protein